MTKMSVGKRERKKEKDRKKQTDRIKDRSRIEANEMKYW
jgi:hypothetical protein